MNDKFPFGYPESYRIDEIRDKVANAKEMYQIDYHGKYRSIPVIEVNIGLPVYRIENIRTKNLQKEWLAKHEETPKDIFVCDPYSIEAQEIQHQILDSLADKEGLKTAFKDGTVQQMDPIICSDNGIVVNGNRRLCAWRGLYYSNKEKYKHFATVRIAVLPDHDEEALYNLEIALQVKNDMKAEYSWHAIAADCKEKAENGMDIKVIAKKQGKKPKEILMYIECYEYAAEHLEAIGCPDQWSLVEDKFYAFQQIVKGKNQLNNPGEKELFKEIAKSMLVVPAEGDRLYSQITKISKNLEKIVPKLEDAFGIEVQDADDDLDILGGGEEVDDSKIQVALGIREADDPNLVVRIVRETLDTQDELEKEKKKNVFILEQVKKAATNLNNAVSNLSDTMIKDGVGKQLDSIEGLCTVLREWIK